MPKTNPWRVRRTYLASRRDYSIHLRGVPPNGCGKRRERAASRGLLQHQPAGRKARDLSRIRQIQLLFDVRPMRLHRFRAQVQPLGDVANVVSFSNKLQDFQFPIAQPMNRRTRIIAAVNVIVNHPV